MTSITQEPISIEKFFSEKTNPACGASAHFVGMVRNHHQGKKVQRLYYECYESMADKQIGHIAEQVKEKHQVDRVRVLHRIGWLEIGDIAIVIEVSSAHRAESFAACREMIDEIKRTVPIWKKEIYADGTSDWVLCCHEAEMAG